MNEGLQLENVTRIVDGEAHLSDINLEFEPGSFNVLLGRTRAGKTSLLRMLAGLDHPSSGRLRSGSRDLTRISVRSRDVAMVYQQFVNYPSMTVYENIAAPLRVRKKLPAKDIDRRVREVAALLHLEALLTRLPAELSGGQQQRTALARALAKDANLLLLDEPLANLDYKLREQLRSELPSLFRGKDAIVVYASAEPGEALQLGGRTIVLDEGRVLQSGRALEVYNAPKNERAALVLSDPPMNLLDAEVTAVGEARLDAELRFALPEHLRSLAPGRYRFGIRANHVHLTRSSAADIRVSAVMTLEEVNGSETLLHASAGALSIAALVPGVHRHPIGAELELFVTPDRLFAFDARGKLNAHAEQAWAASTS
jgi:glycerol transport system ATP-binding protein